MFSLKSLEPDAQVAACVVSQYKLLLEWDDICISQRGGLWKILYVDVPAWHFHFDFLYTYFIPIYHLWISQFCKKKKKKHLILPKLNAFCDNLLKINPISVFKFIRDETPQSLYQNFCKKASQNAGTYTYTMSTPQAYFLINLTLLHTLYVQYSEIVRFCASDVVPVHLSIGTNWSI